MPHFAWYIWVLMAFGYIFSCIIAYKVMGFKSGDDGEIVAVIWPLALVVVVCIALPIMGMVWLVNDAPKLIFGTKEAVNKEVVK